MMEKSKNCWRSVSLISFSFLLTGCGTNIANFETVITNLGASITPLWQLVTAVSYLTGLLFVVRGIFMLKIYGEARTMMTGQANLKGALTYLLIGTILLFSQSIYQALLLSTFNTTATSPLQYTSNINMSQNAYFYLLRFMQLIGLISFVRGWIMLSHLSNQSQQNSFGKAMTHIIGGLLALNIQGTINIIQGTLGIS